MEDGAFTRMSHLIYTSQSAHSEIPHSPCLIHILLMYQLKIKLKKKQRTEKHSSHSPPHGKWRPKSLGGQSSALV